MQVRWAGRGLMMVCVSHNEDFSAVDQIQANIGFLVAGKKFTVTYVNSTTYSSNTSAKLYLLPSAITTYIIISTISFATPT